MGCGHLGELSDCEDVERVKHLSNMQYSPSKTHLVHIEPTYFWPNIFSYIDSSTLVSKLLGRVSDELSFEACELVVKCLGGTCLKILIEYFV